MGLSPSCSLFVVSTQNRHLVQESRYSYTALKSFPPPRSTDLQLVVVHAVHVACVELRVVGHVQQLNDQVAGQELCHERMLEEQVTDHDLEQLQRIMHDDVRSTLTGLLIVRISVFGRTLLGWFQTSYDYLSHCFVYRTSEKKGKMPITVSQSPS